MTTLKGLRTAAMAHIAMHNALNTIKPVYTKYAFEGEEVKADPIAAAAQAAYEVTTNQFPEKQQAFETEL